MKGYYILLLVLAFLVTLIAVPLILLLLFPFNGGLIPYLRLMAGYPVSLAIINTVMKKSSGKGIKELTGKIDARIFAAVFAAIFALSLAGTFLKGNIERNTDPLYVSFISLIISILFVPMQCFSEELIFRILFQKAVMKDGFESPVSQKATALILSSAVFSIMHLGSNEAMMFNSTALSFLYYFASGAFLTGLTFIEKGYAGAIAYHTANNLFIAAAVNSKSDIATLPSSSFFLSESSFDPFSAIFSLISAIVIAGIIELFFSRQRREQIGKEKIK